MRIHNVFHASLLKPFVRRPGAVIHPPALEIDDEEEYEVEALLARRVKTMSSRKCKHPAKGQVPDGSASYTRATKRVEFLVKWAGYGHEHNEWIPQVELQRFCGDMINTFDGPTQQAKRSKTQS